MSRGSFLWIGNHPGLDFCNTEPVLDGHLVDLLAEPADLDRWMADAGARAAGGSTAGIDTLVWARRLRRALRSFLDPVDGAVARGAVARGAVARGAVARGAVARGAVARAELNSVLAEVPATVAIDADGRTTFVPASTAVPAKGVVLNDLRLDLLVLVIGAAALDPARVRRCANPECVLLFYDSSKGGRRRWHDMATCGNRAKAASHYARARSS